MHNKLSQIGNVTKMEGPYGKKNKNVPCVFLQRFSNFGNITKLGRSFHSKLGFRKKT
jgi:hypothetical protein